MTLVNKPKIISRLHFRSELLLRYCVLPLLRVHPLTVRLQLVLPLKLFPAIRALELTEVGMFQEVHPQLVQGGEGLGTVRAGVLPFAMRAPDVLADDAVLFKLFRTVRAGVISVRTVLRHVELQLEHVMETLLANGTLEYLTAQQVSFQVTGQGRVVQKTFVALVTL